MIAALIFSLNMFQQLKLLFDDMWWSVNYVGFEKYEKNVEKNDNFKSDVHFIAVTK